MAVRFARMVRPPLLATTGTHARHVQLNQQSAMT